MIKWLKIPHTNQTFPTTKLVTHACMCVRLYYKLVMPHCPCGLDKYGTKKDCGCSRRNAVSGKPHIREHSKHRHTGGECEGVCVCVCVCVCVGGPLRLLGAACGVCVCVCVCVG